MSLNSMGNAALARNPDFPPANRTPQSLTEQAQVAGSNTSDSVSTALQAITTYIPTEILTLYITLVAVLAPTTPGANGSTATGTSTLTATGPTLNFLSAHWIAFWLFLILTPMAVWATYASKLRGKNLPLPYHLKFWPRWEMSAGTIAFIAWAVALPNSPFIQSFTWFSTGVAGFVLLLASILLGMLAGLFQNPLTSTTPSTSTAVQKN